MQSYNTILGVINMRQNKCTFSTIQQRYHIGTNATQLILKRFKESGIALVELRKVVPHKVETLFYYPPLNLKRKDIPEPDFQYWYDRSYALDKACFEIPIFLPNSDWFNPVRWRASLIFLPNISLSNIMCTCLI